jgi:predicted amidohydrolase
MGDSDIRLAAVCRGWHDCPPEANPYSDIFSLDAARRWSQEQIEAFAGLLDQAGEAGADLAVAAEDIAYLGYAMSYLDDPSIFRTLASETAAKVHEILGEVARRRRTHLVASFFEPEGDQIFNVAVLWGRDGEVIGRYRKVHLPAVETWLVAPGDSFPAFETDLGVVGMLICYDDMWPESTAACALNGARIICHPSAATPTDWRLRTRAADAQVFYISATNRRSRLVSPSAHVLADTEERGEPVAAADVNLADASVCATPASGTIASATSSCAAPMPTGRSSTRIPRHSRPIRPAASRIVARPMRSRRFSTARASGARSKTIPGSGPRSCHSDAPAHLAASRARPARHSAAYSSQERARLTQKLCSPCHRKSLSSLR